MGTVHFGYGDTMTVLTPEEAMKSLVQQVAFEPGFVSLNCEDPDHDHDHDGEALSHDMAVIGFKDFDDVEHSFAIPPYLANMLMGAIADWMQELHEAGTGHCGCGEHNES